MNPTRTLKRPTAPDAAASPSAAPKPPVGGPTAGAHTSPSLAAKPASSRVVASPAGDSVHPDPRLIFAKTELGVAAIRNRSQRVSLAARRLLMLFDGERPLAHLPNIVRPDDVQTLLKELEGLRMITLAGVWHDDPAATTMHPERKLSAIKASLAGVFERELGPEASVLEARVQDCVNLVVLRNVLREVIGLVGQRKDDAAADRIAALVKAHGPF
jgi:hypothetical protein